MVLRCSLKPLLKGYLMKTFSITKKQIINALNTEPIGSPTYATTSKPFSKGTKLSAVGAVVRSLAASHKSAKVIFDLGRDEFNTVAQYNTDSVSDLSTLENRYVAMRVEGMRAPKIRAQLTALVKETFPAKVQVDLWNPAPAIEG